VAGVAGHWWTALAVIAVRLMTGMVVGGGVLDDRQVVRYWYLMPLRDLWGFAVWVAGLSGDTVEWRGQTLRLSADGKVTSPHL
jgi:ceramide glucosyltransferase